MRRNLRIGLVLGIAVLMLLPAYARAQMGLTLTGSGNVDVTGTVVNLSANVGDMVNFSVTPPPSLTNPITYTWWGNASGATWGNANFSWNTSGVAPGPYMVGCEAIDAGQQVEQLVVMISINNSSGGSGSTDTVTVSFSSPPTTGTSGQAVNFTASGSATSCSGTLQYNFTWGDGTSTGWATTATQSHTYSPTTTTSYTVTVQAKCPTDNVTSSLASTTISIQASSGGGGTGTYSQQVATAVKLNQSAGTGVQSYGYYQLTGQAYTIPKGATVYFLIDPVGFGITVNSKTLQFLGGDYTQGKNGVITATIIMLDSSDNLWNGKLPFGLPTNNQMWSYYDYSYQAGKKYLIKVQEMGVKDTPISIWWSVV